MSPPVGFAVVSPRLIPPTDVQPDAQSTARGEHRQSVVAIVVVVVVVVRSSDFGKVIYRLVQSTRIVFWTRAASTDDRVVVVVGGRRV